MVYAANFSLEINPERLRRHALPVFALLVVCPRGAQALTEITRHSFSATMTSGFQPFPANGDSSGTIVRLTNDDLWNNHTALDARQGGTISTTGITIQ